ncbi:LLM class flavin-dependent oxidoreductase [Streptomyces sp. C3-3]|nr:LLM class flavin-dependent oxidoreductase [Streptomyces sp. C3-3]
MTGGGRTRLPCRVSARTATGPRASPPGTRPPAAPVHAARRGAPCQGDGGQLIDPWVYLGALATATSRITLGTASTVLPLRQLPPRAGRHGGTRGPSAAALPHPGPTARTASHLMLRQF